MINLDKKHYAITIETETNISNINLGIDSGVFRFTTEGYQPLVTDAYEDETLVTGTWYGDLLNKDGIKTSTQSIDIIIGGDYSYASSLSIEIVNFNQYHKKLLTTNDLYIIGSKMTMYVIIDGVWYSRWVGSVSEYDINENVVQIQGKDMNNSDNSTVTNFVFGKNPSTTIPITDEETSEIVMLSKPIFRYTPITVDNLSSYVQKFSGPSTEIVSRMLYQYTGAGFSQQYTINSNTRSYVIEVAGLYPNVKAGMYLKLDSSDEMYYILESKRSTNQSMLSTDILIIGDLQELLNTTQLYGIAAPVLPQEVKDDMKKFSEETLTCSVYKKGVRIEPLENTRYNIYNGDRLDVYDADGNLITIRVSENVDGSLTILDKKYAVINKPSKCYYWSETTDTNKTKIDNGEMTHLENYMGNDMSSKIPQDFDISNPSEFNYFVTNSAKYHYFIMEFDTEIAGGIPFTVLSSMNKSTEIWGYETIEGTSWNTLYDPQVPYINGSTNYWTKYSSPYVNTNDKSIDSRFMSFRNQCYRILEDYNQGLIPLVVDEYLLPNARVASEGIPLDSTNSFWSSTTQSINVTNLPYSSINGYNVISSIDGVRTWDYIYTPVFYPWVDGKLEEFENTGSDIAFITKGQIDPKKISAGGNKVMLIIEADNLEGVILTQKDTTYYSRTLAGDVKKPINFANMLFGVNSIGLYKIVEIQSVNDITIPISVETTNTLPKVLSELTGTFVDLPDYNNWYVGGQIIDENKYKVITELCKQSFVCGYTNRFGETKFTTFLGE